jgi:hypothetical protein
VQGVALLRRNPQRRSYRRTPFYVEETKKLSDIAHFFDLAEEGDWRLDILPNPFIGAERILATDDLTLKDSGLVAGSTLRFSR